MVRDASDELRENFDKSAADLYKSPQLHIELNETAFGPGGMVPYAHLTSTGVYQWHTLLKMVTLVQVAPDAVWHGTPLLGRAANAELRSLPSGCIVVMGPSGSGKSAWLVALAKLLGAKILRTAEPESGTQANEAIVPIALRYALDRAIVLDSLRLYTMAGSSLGKGGIPRELARVLTSIDFLGRARQQTIIAVVNLMTDDEPTVDASFALLDASVQAVFNTRGLSRLGTGHGQVNATMTMRPLARQTRQFTTTSFELPAPPEGVFDPGKRSKNED